jgi:N-acyl homoserine lactone hydrolase
MLARFAPSGSLPSIAAAAMMLALFASGAPLPANAGLERLYILNCGEGIAGDISRWSPGVNVGKPMDFVDNCYLIRHTQGWLLWDTGVTDAIAAMPQGQAPSDPRMTHWRRPKTLASQLDQLGSSRPTSSFWPSPTRILTTLAMLDCFRHRCS